MSMKAMNDIREMLCDELDEVSRHGTLNVRDLDVVYKVTQSIANLDEKRVTAMMAVGKQKCAGVMATICAVTAVMRMTCAAGWTQTRMTANINAAMRRICAEQGV